MKIYDISQEVFSCKVFPGDPVPARDVLSSMEDGEFYNLTAFHMCAHNGTHVDAPFHFVRDGKTIDEVGLEPFVGMAYVAEHQGVVTAEDAENILRRASQMQARCFGQECLCGQSAPNEQTVKCESRKQTGNIATKRILIKGDAEISLEAAEVFANAGIFLLGNESQTVGPEDAPMAVHLVLLKAGVVLLEGIRLAEVPEGVYMLNAAPLNLGGADGAPCRAVLIELE